MTVQFTPLETPMGHAELMPFVAGSDFLTWDASQTLRHEFVDGKVFLREGAEDRHVTVCGNLGMALRQHLRGTPCRTYMIDMKLNVATANQYFYPDVMVTCSATDQANPLIKSEPKLIIEVLSPSTTAYDRGLKFGHYRALRTLQEYVLVDLDTRITDCYRKGADGLWVLHPFGKGDTVKLASVDLEISAAALFAEVV
jgi:Uma2 family endonuclease